MSDMTIQQVREIIHDMCNSESVAPTPNPMCDAVCKLVDASDCYALRAWIDAHLAKLSAPVSEEDADAAWDVYADHIGGPTESMQAALTDFLARRFGEGK